MTRWARMANLFSQLSGYSMHTEYHRLPRRAALHPVSGPRSERIEREVANHEAGLPAHIRKPGATPSSTRRSSTPCTASMAESAGRCPGAGDLRDPPAGPRPEGEPSGAQHPRRFLEHSRAYEFLATAANPGMDRIGGSDAPQPRPPGRDPGLVAFPGTDRVCREKFWTRRSTRARPHGTLVLTDNGFTTRRRPVGNWRISGLHDRRKHLRGG